MIFGKDKDKKPAETKDSQKDQTARESAAKDCAQEAQAEPAAEAAPAGDAPAAGAAAEPEAEASEKAASNPDAERAAKLEADLALAKDAHLRLMADFENSRRRASREREEIVKRANENLVESLLPVLDSMDLALKQKPEADDPFSKGIVMVFDLLRKTLSNAGLEPIDAKGKHFDPQIHEAIVSAPSADVPEGVVIEQTRRGYTLNGHMLRAAQVVVSSGAPEQPPAAAGDAAADKPAKDAAAEKPAAGEAAK